ncbi:MAG: carbohydrate-binding domain-containing protein [Lachnospiraceae bacterium]|jgi:hypothetical protein|nr:carbohydrate-binding domain-containing protein [Lachnospiraceae bacterium]
MIKKYGRVLMAGTLTASMILMTACTGTAGNASSASTSSTVSGTTIAADGDETGSVSTLEVTSDMSNFKDSDEYTDWSSGTYTSIAGNGSSVSVSGTGVTYSGCDVTITQPGTYVFSGTIDEGSITVKATDTSKVRIVLNGVTITNSDGPVISSVTADKLVISLEKGTENTLTDGTSYADEDQTAVIYSKTDLVFNGDGSLTVNANYKDAVCSKDDLRIVSGTYTVTAADDGFIGKDRLEIKDGTFSVTCGGDAFKSTNDEDTTLGYTYIENGTFTIASGDEAFQAETGIYIADGTYDITTGGGSANASGHTDQMGGGSFGGNKPDGGTTPGTGDTSGSGSSQNSGSSQGGNNSQGGFGTGTFAGGPGPQMNQSSQADSGSTTDTQSSALLETAAGTSSSAAASGTEDTDTDTDTAAAAGKGIKANGTITIDGGSFTMDTVDDSIHSNYAIVINGGTFSISSGDDGIHADETLTVNDGDITVAKSYEGLESALITINGGNISATASDDGINAAGGDASTDSTAAGTTDSTAAGTTDSTADTSGSSTSAQTKTMGGGMAGGMQSDSTGYLVINGGTIYVNAGGDGLDANSTITQTGGDIVVDGPTDDGNGALDYGTEYKMTGGSVLAIGSSGMLQAVSDDSTVKCLTVVYSSSQEAGTVITVKDSSGNTVFTQTAAKQYDSFVYAGDNLKEGETYTVYSNDTQLCTVTLSGTVTTVDDSGNATTAGTMGGGTNGGMGGGHMGRS